MRWLFNHLMPEYIASVIDIRSKHCTADKWMWAVEFLHLDHQIATAWLESYYGGVNPTQNFAAYSSVDCHRMTIFFWIVSLACLLQLGLGSNQTRRYFIKFDNWIKTLNEVGGSNPEYALWAECRKWHTYMSFYTSVFLLSLNSTKLGDSWIRQRWVIEVYPQISTKWWRCQRHAPISKHQRMVF